MTTQERVQARPKRLLNLDAIVADQTESVVVWRGQEHAIADMSVDTFLRYTQMEEKLRGATDVSTPAEQMKPYLDIFELMIPTLPLDDIRRQPLAVVTELANFVMGAVSDMMGAPGEAGGAEAATDSPLE